MMKTNTRSSMKHVGWRSENFPQETQLCIPVVVFVLGCMAATVVSFLLPSHTISTSSTSAGLDNNMMPLHIIPPRRTNAQLSISNMTLRDFLLHPDGFHLAMAPSFFGFYGYFGALAGLEEGLFMDHNDPKTVNNVTTTTSSSSLLIQHGILKGVAGASAGAMAAILLAAGISPIQAAEFCTTIQLHDFFDFPAWFSLIKGDKFEDIMQDFLQRTSPIVTKVAKKVNATTIQSHPPDLQLQDALIPVGVSAFDLQTLQGKILTQGSMARAARASACFPILFQPVGWIEESTGNDFLFVDGGLRDTSGLAGLAVAYPLKNVPKRVVNMVVGDFHLQSVPGPSSMPPGLTTSSLLSISIQNLPLCGPWAMEKGPLAVAAARQAMQASLDLPIYQGHEDGHYELHIDASYFA